MRRSMRCAIHIFFPFFLLLAAAAPLAGSEPPLDALAKTMAEAYGGERPRLWGEALPGIVTRLDPGPSSLSGHNENAPPVTVALTLDACGGGTDMRIIALLREHAVPATIFATNLWLRRNARTAAELAADPLFTLACHGSRHKPASVSGATAYGIAGTKNVADLVEEVEANARAITAITGKRPRWYRAGTAFYDDVALRIIRDLGFAVAGYSLNGDEGATLAGPAVARRLLGVTDRAIIICHLNRPAGGTAEGLARAIPALLEKGVVFVPLEKP